MKKSKEIKWIRKHISVEVTPKPGWDIYVVEFYFDGKRVGLTEVDGFALEVRGFK